MTTTYSEIFDFRGHSYDEAMRRFPNARKNEFKRLFDGVEREQLNTVLDIPSGGGYLGRYLPANVEILAYDSSHSFMTDNQSVRLISLEALDLPANIADLAISLAATHHIENKHDFFDSVLRSLKPGGQYCIADVLDGSKIARFLDEFVAQYNGTGHEAVYLDRLSGDLINQNATVKLYRNELVECEWVFNNQREMIEFSRLLFHLTNITDDQIDQALRDYIGVREHPGGCFLQWELLYIGLEKTCAES